MDLWIAKDGQKLGPFSHDDVIHFLQQSRFSPGDLAWREGLQSWVPLGQILPLAPSDPSGSPLTPGTEIEGPEPTSGIVSFWVGIVGIAYWVILLTLAGLAALKGLGSDNALMMTIGLFVFIGFGVNIVAIVLGIVGASKRQRRRTLSVLGITINSVEFLGVVSLMILGMSSKS
jgi:hypothetical protein